MARTRLLVGNLARITSEEDLKVAFSSHGQVVSVTLIVDERTGRHRGFALVEMASAAEAMAGRTLHGSRIDGKTITVDTASQGNPGAFDNTERGYGGGWRGHRRGRR